MNYRSLPYFLIFILFISCSTHQVEPDPSEDWRNQAEQIVRDIPEVEIPDNRIDIIEFSGMQPDVEGSNEFRKAIQQAISALAEQGGGTLYFPHIQEKDEWVKQVVTYRVRGPVHLKDNIELRFEAGVRLFFEFDPESYMISEEGTLRRFEGTTIYSFSPLIYAFNKKNIALTSAGGSGAPPTIDGDGMRWLAWRTAAEKRKSATKDTLTSKVSIRDINNADVPLAERHFTDLQQDIFRPELMSFVLCENILIDGLQLVNSPFWMVHPVFSENMIFRNLVFDGQVANNDAFDIESSRNALMENIQFNNHDDNLAIKAGRDKEGRDGVDVSGTELENIKSRFIKNGRLGGATENVVIRNAVFKGHHAVSIGSEMSGGVRNVYAYDNFSPIEVENGLYLKSSRKRGGEIRDVYFFNNHFQKMEAIAGLIPNYDGDTTSAFVPRFSDIYIHNNSAAVTNYGIRVLGWPEKPIENVFISNIRVDSVTRKGQEIDLFNVRNARLSNVYINGKTWNETISRVDSTAKPPFYK